jgi:thymidylate synthase (FAD)
MALVIERGSHILRPYQNTQILKLVNSSIGTVELLDCMGDDLAIVNAARVSFGKETWWREEWNHSGDEQPIQKYVLDTKDRGVLNYLMREHHGSPWEMATFKFRVKCAIKVLWDWIRHRMSSFNVKSTRYTDWDDEFYMPVGTAWRTPAPGSRPGHYKMVPMQNFHHASVVYEAAMVHSMNAYKTLLSLDEPVARELAANVLPMGAFTEFIWTVNLRSLFNFCALRNADTALFELHELAAMIEFLAKQVTPVAFDLFDAHNRVAP